MFGRILCGKPVATFPENALRRDPDRDGVNTDRSPGRAKRNPATEPADCDSADGLRCAQPILRARYDCRIAMAGLVPGMTTTG
jgi:hypothetical protein